MGPRMLENVFKHPCLATDNMGTAPDAAINYTTGKQCPVVYHITYWHQSAKTLAAQLLGPEHNRSAPIHEWAFKRSLELATARQLHTWFGTATLTQHVGSLATPRCCRKDEASCGPS